MKHRYTTLYLENTDSTNNEAKKLPESDNMSVIYACEQTAGRGQRGNSWHSKPGQNLTFSILVRWGRDGVPDLKAKEQFFVSRIVTVALTDLLAARNIQAGIKWPNDIYVGDRKICGILIENTVKGDRLSSSVIGIGLNINETDFPADIPNPTSVRCEIGKEEDVRKCLEEYIGLFDSYLSATETAEGRNALEKTYLEKMYRKDAAHRYIDMRNQAGNKLQQDYKGREFTGIIRGVAPNACLIVENEKGGLEQFAFKEIAYII